jgi:hypothetical protein
VHPVLGRSDRRYAGIDDVIVATVRTPCLARVSRGATWSRP